MLPTPGQLGDELVVVQVEMGLVVDLVGALQDQAGREVVIDSELVLLAAHRHVNRRTGRRAGEYFEDVLVARPA